MLETDLQLHIKMSVLKDGGACKKLTNRFTIGIPDLLIRLAPFAMCLIEVKELGECVANFDRQIEVTPKQKENLKAFAPFSGIFVGLVWSGARRLVALPYDADRLSGRILTERSDCGSPRGTGNYYDISRLLKTLNMKELP